MFCICMFSPFKVMISVSSLISLLSFCLPDLSIGESGMLKSPTISVWGLMGSLCFSNICFTYLGGLIFGAEMLRTETSS